MQLVIFDLMGTLVRDDGIVEAAYDSALDQAGVTGPDRDDARTQIAALRGRPTLDVLNTVLGDPVRAEEATWSFDDSVLDAVDRLEPLPGVDAVLSSLDEAGVAAAVTTSFGADVRTAILRKLGWTGRFAAEMSARGTMRGHPAPDLLLEAILALRIDSVAQVAIVGDTAADLEAGNRAGAGLVIGVLTGAHDRERLTATPHTHLVDSVADVPGVLAAPRRSGHRRRSD